MRQPAHNGSVLRQSQTAISAQIRGAAGMCVGSGPILLKGSTGRTDDFCAAVVPVLVG
jgi:hypothetical protein